MLGANGKGLGLIRAQEPCQNVGGCGCIQTIYLSTSFHLGTESK